MQKSEELRESGAAPYSDMSCAVVSLASRGQNELCPNCIHFSCYSRHVHVHYGFHHYAWCYILFWLVWLAYFRVINDPLFNEKGGGRIFVGGHIFERLQYLAAYRHMPQLRFAITQQQKLSQAAADI